MSEPRTAIWVPDREQLLLLRAALWNGERGFAAWREWRRTNPDIDELEKGSYRLLPLVYRNLGPLLAEDPDAGRLKGVYRRSWAENQLVLKTGRRAIEALHGAGLEVLALKGGALLSSAYRDIGARPMSDLDLAVRAERIEVAVEALEAAGFAAERGNPLPILAVHHSLGFFDDEEREIDLHRGLQWRAGIDEDLWRQAVPVEVGGAAVLTLCPPDQLLHVCVHGAGWNPIQPIRWVADAFKVLEAAGADFDWARLVAMGTRGRLHPAAGRCPLIPGRGARAGDPGRGARRAGRRPRLQRGAACTRGAGTTAVLAPLDGDAVVVLGAAPGPGGPRRDQDQPCRIGPLPAGLLGPRPAHPSPRPRGRATCAAPGLSGPRG